jgi:hypothetical protein
MLRGPPLFILAIVALVLCMASVCAPAFAAAPAARPELPAVINADGFVCVSPDGQETKHQPLPPGEKIDALCAPAARLYLTYNPAMLRGLRPIPGARPVEFSQQQQPPETQKPQQQKPAPGPEGGRAPP